MILVFRSKATKLACGFLLSYAVLHASITSLRAQTFQHFTISNIYIDASADTAIAARSIALSVGQRDAFQQLMTRLALSEYYSKLPSLDNAAIAALVQGLEIEEEKIGSARYLAKLTVNFKRDAIRSLMRNHRIPYSETPSKPVLVLPIYEVAGARNLWDEPNPWWTVWAERAQELSVVPFIMPEGDLRDVHIIGVEQALVGDRDSLEALYERYKVNDILVAHGVLRQDLVADIPRLTVNVYRHGAHNNSMTVESFSGKSRNKLDALLTSAVAKVAKNVEEGWKRMTMLRFDDQGYLSVSVPLNRLEDWVDLRDGLLDAAEITKVDTLEFNRNAAQIGISYFGTPLQLSISLAQRDLKLINESGFWTLKSEPGSKPKVPELSRY